MDKKWKIRGAVYENQRVAVLLWVNDDDHRLPPYILLQIAKRFLRMGYLKKMLMCMHKE